MARIRVAERIGAETSHRHSQWFDVVNADALRRQIDGLLDLQESEDGRTWEVVDYDGLPDFGPQPDLDELLAWLDAVDEFGVPFEVWWATRAFGRVIEALMPSQTAIRELTLVIPPTIEEEATYILHGNNWLQVQPSR